MNSVCYVDILTDGAVTANLILIAVLIFSTFWVFVTYHRRTNGSKKFSLPFVVILPTALLLYILIQMIDWHWIQPCWLTVQTLHAITSGVLGGVFLTFGIMQMSRALDLPPAPQSHIARFLITFWRRLWRGKK